MENDIKEIQNTEKYPKIKGKYKTMFGIPSKSIKILHTQLYELYSRSHIRNLVKPKDLHTIITNFFIKEYYPIISKNYHTNEKTIAILMGTIGFNLNIPNNIDNLNKLLYTDTDDIDLKIYTTELHYDKSKNNKSSVKSVLSLFKYVIITLFMYMKQIMAEIIDFTKNMFSTPQHIFKKELSKKSKKKSQTQKSQTQKLQTGGKNNPGIKQNQKSFGVLSDCRIYIQIKKGFGKEQTHEKIDITRLSYEDTYTLLFEKINDIDLLITSKLKYWVTYSKLLNVPKFLNALTFSDTKIYYPNLEENSTFYAYYLLNNDNEKENISNLTLDSLYNKHININEIIKSKHCGKSNNNCNYIVSSSLKVDLILMLQYAEFINDEDYENNNIIVPISSLFKYIKYFTKYLKLYIIIKFYNKTLTKEYMNNTKKLIYYVNKIFNKTIIEPETAQINIDYKKQINKLHQAFFIKQTMFPEYKVLKEVVDDYNNIKQYINKSRFLFKDLYEKYNYNNSLCNTKIHNVNLLNILNIIYSQDQNGGGKKINNKCKSILYGENNYRMHGNLNNELNNEVCDIYYYNKLKEIHKYSKYNSKHKLYKNINISKKISNMSYTEKTELIMNNIHNILKNDIKQIEDISKNI